MANFTTRPERVEAERNADGSWTVTKGTQTYNKSDEDFRREHYPSDTRAELELKKEIAPPKKKEKKTKEADVEAETQSTDSTTEFTTTIDDHPNVTPSEE